MVVSVMMKSVRLHGPEKLVYESIRKPSKPAADEVLIKVSAVGICGSDLHMYETANFTGASLNPPFILGHEFCGIVLECGGKSPMDGFHQPLSVGQRVAVEPNMPCEKCEWCKRGQPNLCPYHSFSGCSPVDGALCELMTVRARNCFPLPDHISDESGALLETLGVGIHSINLGHMRIGDSVGVFGCGPVGLILVKLAKLHGARKIFALIFFHGEWRRHWNGALMRLIWPKIRMWLKSLKKLPVDEDWMSPLKPPRPKKPFEMPLIVPRQAGGWSLLGYPMMITWRLSIQQPGKKDSL